jgi:hypothetical protein
LYKDKINLTIFAFKLLSKYFFKISAMEIKLKKSGKYRGVRILFCCLSIFLLVAVNHVVGQTATPDSSASAVLDSASADGGPSLKNLSKTFNNGITPEMKKIQEEAKRDEIFGYILMGLGFSLVIAVAWFTTSLAKKRRLKEDEARAKRAQVMHNLHPHRKPRR